MSARRRLEPETIVPFDDALRMIRDATPQLPAENVALTDAVGRVLAEAVTAAESVPGFDASTVDGFAVRSADLGSAGPHAPVELHVAAAIPAGASWDGMLESGRCARISTGAPVPSGADAVVPLEWTTWEESRVAIERAPAAGTNIRRMGEDVRVGETILDAGDVLNVARIGLLASTGVRHVHARCRPRVAFACTGNEIVNDGEPLSPGKIRGSNHLTLAGQIAQAGGVPVDLGRAPDDPASLAAMLRDVHDADVVITSGGVSVGDHDPVKDAFARLGVERRFWRVAASPGKPVYFGVRGSVLYFGLPGNPVSSMVTFECFVRPALRRMQGDASPDRPRIPARLAHDVKGSGPRRHFARVTMRLDEQGFVATEVGPRGSGNLRSMALADALAIIPEGTQVLAAGTVVEVVVLDAEAWSRAFPK